MINLVEVTKKSFCFDQSASKKLPWHIRDLDGELLYKVFGLITGCGDYDKASGVEKFSCWIDQNILGSFFSFEYDQSDCLVIERVVQFQYPIKMDSGYSEGGVFLDSLRILNSDVVNLNEMKLCHHVITTNRGLAVVWDRSVSPSDIKKVFTKVDNLAEKMIWN